MNDKAEKDRIILYRTATSYDIVKIGRLIEDAHKQSGAPYPPIHLPTMMDWINRVIATGFVVVADLSGRVVGSLGMEPFRYGWAAEPCLTNAWFYVDPVYRKRGTAAQLMGLAKSFADKHNSFAVIGIQDIVDAELKDEFLKMQGWKYGGGLFLRWPEVVGTDKLEEDADQ